MCVWVCVCVCAGNRWLKNEFLISHPLPPLFLKTWFILFLSLKQEIRSCNGRRYGLFTRETALHGAAALIGNLLRKETQPIWMIALFFRLDWIFQCFSIFTDAGLSGCGSPLVESGFKGTAAALGFSAILGARILPVLAAKHNFPVFTSQKQAFSFKKPQKQRQRLLHGSGVCGIADNLHW